MERQRTITVRHGRSESWPSAPCRRREKERSQCGLLSLPVCRRISRHASVLHRRGVVFRRRGTSHTSVRARRSRRNKRASLRYSLSSLAPSPSAVCSAVQHVVGRGGRDSSAAGRRRWWRERRPASHGRRRRRRPLCGDAERLGGCWQLAPSRLRKGVASCASKHSSSSTNRASTIARLRRGEEARPEKAGQQLTEGGAGPDRGGRRERRRRRGARPGGRGGKPKKAKSRGKARDESDASDDDAGSVQYSEESGVSDDGMLSEASSVSAFEESDDEWSDGEQEKSVARSYNGAAAEGQARPEALRALRG